MTTYYALAAGMVVCGVVLLLAPALLLATRFFTPRELRGARELARAARRRIGWSARA